MIILGKVFLNFVKGEMTMCNTILKQIETNKLEKITIFMGLVGHLATYIQVFKIFYLQSSYAVSFIATIISFASMVFWLLYGMEKQITPLIVCNIFGLMGVSLVIFGIILYGDNFL
jgi:uncharacterized protein with PQ loop repeat